MCSKNNKKHFKKEGGAVVVKQGYILKEPASYGLKNESLTPQGRLLRSIFGIQKLVYDAVKEDVAKIYALIDKAKEDIELLEIQNRYSPSEEYKLQNEINAVAKNMCREISYLINKISKSTYETVYKSLIRILTETSATNQVLPDEDLEINGIYDKINTWLEDFKSWLLGSINASFENSLSENKSYVQKGLFNNIFENIRDTFEKSKEKTESAVRNAILNVWTVADKIAFKVARVEAYQVILSGHPNACEKCKEMAEKTIKNPINIADLKVGVTAPPFHPNCGCMMIPRNAAVKDGSLREQLAIALNVALEFLAQIGPTEKLFPPFYGFVKSAISGIGNFYLQSQGWDITRALFNWGMYGNGRSLPNKVKNMLIEELKKSNILREKIREYTKGVQSFDSGKTWAHFTPEEPALHYSVQKVDLWLKGNKLKDGRWKVNVKLEDDYDFTEFRNSLRFTDLANNLGEAMQRNGMMKEYKTEVEFTHIFEGV